VVIALAAALLVTAPQSPPTTENVAEQYLELTFSQQYDALADLYAPDVRFSDPTADLFGGPGAGEYLAAYVEQRHDDMAALLAPGVLFQDPTAQIFAADGGVARRGDDVVMAAICEGFAPVFEFGMEVEKAVYTNHHAIFMGTCSYTLEGAALGIQRESASFEHQSVVIVEVVEGKVVTHLDYLDYSTFEEQLLAQMGSP